jgi:hypothetical protein
VVVIIGFAKIAIDSEKSCATIGFVIVKQLLEQKWKQLL